MMPEKDGMGSTGSGPRWLVIGYGNDLRSDDGVAHEVVRRVENLRLADVVCRSYHQLTPELADLIKDFSRVVFVDAMDASRCDVVRATRLEWEGPWEPCGAHVSSPQYLMRLASELYHARPEAWMITVPALNFDFGLALTPTALEGCAHAVEKVVDLCQG